MKKCFSLLFFMGLLVGLCAQDLTGRWVVVTGYNSGYYAELYLINNKDNLYSGHSYDTENNGFCRHFLDAQFDPKTARFTGKDVELIDKSPEHEATDYNLRYVEEDGREYLVGTQTIMPLSQARNGEPDLNRMMTERLYRMFGYGVSEVRYVKVSDEYVLHTPAFPNVMNPDEMELRKAEFPELEDVPSPEDDGMVLIPEPDEGIVAPPSISEPRDLVPEVPDSDTDAEDPIVVAPPAYEPDSPEKILEKKSARSNVVAAHIRIPFESVSLHVLDYGTEDDDRISIFYNDELIADNLDLSHEPVVFELPIIAGQRNELVIVANNLGEIPPNTAQVRILAGDRQYSYRLFTDESQNALILLESY